jgi:hypothetical protein
MDFIMDYSYIFFQGDKGDIFTPQLKTGVFLFAAKKRKVCRIKIYRQTLLNEFTVVLVRYRRH